MDSTCFLDALHALTSALDHLVPVFFLVTTLAAIFAARAAAHAARIAKQDLLLRYAPQLTARITRVTKPLEQDGKWHFQVDVEIGNIGTAQVLVTDVRFEIGKKGFHRLKDARLETGPRLIPPNGTDKFSVTSPTSTSNPEELDRKTAGAEVTVIVNMTDVRGKKYELEAIRKPTVNPSLADAAQTGEWTIVKHEYRGHVFDALKE